MIQCPICSLKLIECQYNEHFTYCSSKTIECKICKLYIRYKDLEDHYKLKHPNKTLNSI